MDTRTLPTVIGPTENALRALLIATVADFGITGNEQWVTLNMGAAGAATAQIAGALHSSEATVKAVRSELVHSGLLTDTGILTDQGTAALGAARTRVAGTTAELVEGIDPLQLEAALTTLDLVRSRAEARLGPTTP